MNYWERYKDINVLVGKTITELEGMHSGSERISIVCQDGSRFEMYHEQDCCESVYLYDVAGDPVDIVGEEILEAYSSSDTATDVSESGTWTFYNIRTRIGGVNLRWLGTSNGYYSEGVSFVQQENVQ